ncbi:MAG: hypothetical protein QNJ94_04905 [Alphaproteobacteria bacterium]|nr:hypothetical protein [Alphaproteobacteria bacterium]
MRRPVIWLLLVFIAGTGLYYLKYRVQMMEARLAAIHRTLLAEQEALHVLAAEWTYLNRPERLAKLNRQYTKLQPIRARQMVGFEDIPTRPALSAVSDEDTP